jgi:hypothetical protein
VRLSIKISNNTEIGEQLLTKGCAQQ